MTKATAALQRFHRHDETTTVYELVIITDEDEAAQTMLDNGEIAWQSAIRYDRLHRSVDPEGDLPRYHFDEIPPEQGGEHRLTSLIAEEQRGAGFSELLRFGRHLLAFDDRTGLVCEVREGHRLIPRQIPMTGSGDERFKGFKSEWVTLQGNQVVVGSHGKSREEEWIKRIDHGYRIESVECGEITETYPFCFRPDGTVLQDDVFVGPYKCEGVEIL